VSDVGAACLCAVVFDFDGVMCDTEWVEYEATRLVWAEHGAELTIETWAPVIGVSWGVPWLDQLESIVGPVDRDRAAARRSAVHHDLNDTQPMLPGVLSLLDEADALAVPVGVASNSDLGWVHRHLTRLGVRDRVRTIRAIDTVPRGKPHPDPYLLACADLGAAPGCAVAFEDSHTGVTAAVAAGLYTVAVPHVLTEGHDVSAADRIVSSLAEVSLAALPVRFGS
jgi:HAD superfamily hydrolase (TIGR01509 family)